MQRHMDLRGGFREQCNNAVALLKELWDSLAIRSWLDWTCCSVYFHSLGDTGRHGWLHIQFRWGVVNWQVHHWRSEVAIEWVAVGLVLSTSARSCQQVLRLHSTFHEVNVHVGKGWSQRLKGSLGLCHLLGPGVLAWLCRECLVFLYFSTITRRPGYW